jgi:hypothetical protein|nr:MAG TPA_asm: hypothetical protein [Caudoviricetes sp.]
MNVVIKFLKYFICKWFGTIAIEKIVIILLRELVERTDSKVDDEIFKAIFEKTSEEVQ